MSDEATTIPARRSIQLPNFEMPDMAQEWVDRVGGKRRAGSLGIGVAAVLLVLGVARWATAPTWVPLYSGMSIEQVGAVVERLDEVGIPYDLQGGGTELMVASDNLAKARVALAQGDGMPTSGRPGLEIFDQPAWGMTDFTQRIQYQRALEGELERTIGAMGGVESVKVHLAMEENTSFNGNGRPAEASVVVKLARSAPPGPEMVEGISHLVASSVDGIEADHVMVLDQSGKLLSDPYEKDSPAALASRELKMRNEIEQYLSQKAEKMVGQMVGPGNVRIQVSADINLDRVERTVETVDPDRQVLASEQRSEIVPGADGGAGSVSVTSTYLNTRSVETYSGAVGNVRRVSAAVLVNDKLIVDPETGERSYEARTPEEIAEIQMLASNAMGLDVGRGDVINVVSFPFDGALVIPREPTFLDLAIEYQRPAIALIALLAVMILAFRITRTLKTPEAPADPAQLAKGAKLNMLVGEGEGDEELDAAEEQEALEAAEAELALAAPKKPKKPTHRDHVIAQIEAQPDVAMKMIRAWMREE